MNDKVVCKVIDNVRVCLDPDHPHPFDQSKELNTILRENTEYHLQFADSCKVQGISCFEINLKTLSIYFVIYLVAALLINFLHELFHFSVFYFSGENTDGFTFGFNLGQTNISELPPTASHSVWWWYLAVMGPLLFVNFGSVFILHYIYKPSYRIFRTHVDIFDRIGEAFGRAIAYISTIAILVNTIFSPLLQLLSAQLRYGMKSDMIWAWDVSLTMSNERYPFSEYYIWAIILVSMIAVSAIFKYNENLRNLSVAVAILTVFSAVFFFEGISDRLLFQWLIISSVVIETIFALTYVLRFGRRFE